MAEAGPLVTAYVSVGSNIEPETNIPRALGLLAERAHVVAVSTFCRTQALERPGQPAFLNGVCAIMTPLAAHDLKFTVLRGIEADLGRVRGNDRYAARPIDLDLVLFGDEVLDEEGLRIPDPDIRTRPFVAAPLLELAPDAVLPDTREPLREVVSAIDTVGLRADREFTNVLRARLGL